MAEDPNALIAVRLTKPYRNYNAGDIAGFDYPTTKALVDADAAEVLEVKVTVDKDPKTGEPFKRHKVVGTRPLEPIAKKASPPPATTATPTGDAGGTPSGTVTPTGGGNK